MKRLPTLCRLGSTIKMRSPIWILLLLKEVATKVVYFPAFCFLVQSVAVFALHSVLLARMEVKINDAFGDNGFTFREGVFLVAVLVTSGIETFLSNWLGLLILACIGATVTVVAIIGAPEIAIYLYLKHLNSKLRNRSNGFNRILRKRFSFRGYFFS